MVFVDEGTCLSSHTGLCGHEENVGIAEQANVRGDVVSAGEDGADV